MFSLNPTSSQHRGSQPRASMHRPGLVLPGVSLGLRSFPPLCPHSLSGAPHLSQQGKLILQENQTTQARPPPAMSLLSLSSLNLAHPRAYPPSAGCSTAHQLGPDPPCPISAPDCVTVTRLASQHLESHFTKPVLPQPRA